MKSKTKTRSGTSIVVEDESKASWLIAPLKKVCHITVKCCFQTFLVVGISHASNSEFYMVCRNIMMFWVLHWGQLSCPSTRPRNSGSASAWHDCYLFFSKIVNKSKDSIISVSSIAQTKSSRCSVLISICDSSCPTTILTGFKPSSSLSNIFHKAIVCVFELKGLNTISCLIPD